MRTGPDLRKLKLSTPAERRRRRIKLQRNDAEHRGQRIFWCDKCDRYTHNLHTHICGKRQS